MINLLTAGIAATGTSIETEAEKMENRLVDKDDNDVQDWFAKLFYQQYFQKVMLSDGTDPDNELQW